MTVPNPRPAARGVVWLIISFSLAAFAGVYPSLSGQNPPAVKPAPKSSSKPNPDVAPTSAPQEESEALQNAFQSAAGNPQALIKNLEGFLARFPQSSRREQVLRTIFRQALQGNNPEKALASAENLLELNPADPQLLSALVDLVDRQTNPSAREHVIPYATRFIEHTEKMAQERQPLVMSAEKWHETQALMRATGYLMRGKVYEKSCQIDRAMADYQQSYAAFPTAQAAERLADLAAKRGESDRAIDFYATAFAFTDQSADPAHREQLRKKLGSAYLAKYGSEKGLGDLILSHYDELARLNGSRFKARDVPNAQAHDPFDFILIRLDGSELRLKEFRGKVVVMDFWATWCAPCRLEGKLFGRVKDIFRNEPSAVFLAVNTDEDRSGVPTFIQEEQWTVPVVYAQGLDRLLGVRALPTLVIFDRQGQVVFREEGLNPEKFVETVETRVREAVKPS